MASLQGAQWGGGGASTGKKWIKSFSNVRSSVTAIVKSLKGTAFETSLHTHKHTYIHTHTQTHTHTQWSGCGAAQILKSAVDHTSYIHLARRLRICVGLLGLQDFVDFFSFFSFMSGSWAAGFRRDDVTARARCVSENHQKALCCLLWGSGTTVATH